MHDIQKELEMIDKFEHPHLFFVGENEKKKNISYQIIKDYATGEILIIDPYGFSIDSVFAGITETHIEYIAKNAPNDYKKAILNILKDRDAMKSVFEIVKDMDNDISSNLNQNRTNNVIQYIKDNQAAFKF